MHNMTRLMTSAQPDSDSLAHLFYPTIFVVMAGFCIFTFIVHSSISEALVWPNTALQHPSGKIAEQPCLMHSGHKITEVRGGGGKEKAPIPLPQGVAVRTPLSNIWTHMKLEKRMSVD